MRQTLRSSALVGLRCTHFLPRAKIPVRRAGSVRALASVPNPQPARAQTNSDALDLSRAT